MEKIKCVICNRIFKAYKSQIKNKQCCSKACEGLRRSPILMAEKHHNWKGGRRLTTQGYILIHAPNHPNAKKNYYFEHRIIVEKHIKRILKKSEHVHHINGIRTDNRIENLQILSNSEHCFIHMKLTKWSRNFEKCVSCGTKEIGHNAKGYCKKCYDRLLR